MSCDPGFPLLDDLKGFLDEAEGGQLYAIASVASRLGPCLEIGSYCGKSTVFLGSACRKNGAILFAVDHHRGSEEQQPGAEYFDSELFNARTGRVDTFCTFRQTLERSGLEETVVPLVCRSETAARQWATPLSLVFIDGGHSLEAVETDYRLWHPHLKPGGFLLIHDIFKDPARGGQAPYQVYRQALSSGLFTARPMVNTLGVLQRRSSSRAMGRRGAS